MIYVFIAEGFEETEALVPTDLLRRAEQEVVTVGIGSCVIRGSHGIPVVTDTDDKQIAIDENVDMIILPGGMPGTLNLEKSEIVQQAVDHCVSEGKYIAAICAAPSILGKKGLLDGKEAVCFPGFEQFLQGARLSDKSVVCDFNGTKIITAKGAGAAIKFGLKLVEVMCGKERADKLHDSLQCDD